MAMTRPGFAASRVKPCVNGKAGLVLTTREYTGPTYTVDPCQGLGSSLINLTLFSIIFEV